MSATVLRGVLPGFRFAMSCPAEARLTDGELLERFIQHQDDQAFEKLVRQHGPMVLGVCRRILRNETDAEDAFQATFLVLVRKAGSILPRNLVGNWLYGVAYFTANKAKAMSTKRAVRERAATLPAPADHRNTMDELCAMLDQELQSLPAKYRSAIVLCDLEGKTIRQVAEQLGCPSGTIGARLSRGRTMLAERITRRRGLIASGMLTACLAQTSAALPPSLLGASSLSCIKTGSSAKVLTLANAVMQTMLLSKLKLLALPVAVLLLSTAGVAAGNWIANPTSAVAVVAKAESNSPVQAPTKPVKAENFIWSVAFTPDDKSLIISEGTKLVRLWDRKTQLPGRAFEGPTKIIRSVAVSPDGKLLAGGGDEGVVFVWDLATGKLLYQVDASSGMINTVAFSPDGASLAVGSSAPWKLTDTYCAVLDSPTGRVLKKMVSTRDRIPAGAGIALAFRPDGKEIAVLHLGKFTGVVLFDIQTGQETKRIPYEEPFIPQSVAYSPDGQHLVTGDVLPAMPNPNDARLFGLPVGHVRLWDPSTGKLVETLLDDSVGDVKSLVFTKTTNLLIAGTTVKLGEQFGSPNGRVGLLGGHYICWDTRGWNKMWDSRMRGGLTFGMSLSPDERYLAVANSAGCSILDLKDVGGVENRGMVQFAVTPESPPAKP